MLKPHKHSELIKLWADGAKIQFYQPVSESWIDIAGYAPEWCAYTSYRIKPEPKPDVSFYARLVMDDSSSRCHIAMPDPQLHNLKLTFDGETGQLKAAEVLE